jgi:preprotein translocase subunit SecA
VPAFALVRESIRRVLGLELREVQLHGGLVLARGAVAEMQTGEGKTVTAVAPAFLHALAGQGVHVATVNQYLADRDFQLLRPVFHLLGLTIGCLHAGGSPDQKRAAYACDVTYGPGFEFGFDYLRDQIARMHAPRPVLGHRFRRALQGRPDTRQHALQRGHAMVIIDEIDSVLIDEARTPLVLSGVSQERDFDPTPFLEARRVAENLEADEDYRIDEQQRSVNLTETGIEKAQDAWGRIPQVTLKRPWTVYVEQALQAQLLLRRDVNYVVFNDLVQIVDDSTGRIFADRSWRNGLHQAVEAKEQLPVTSEKETLAHISRQRYVRNYKIISGMTGTATGSEDEFRQLYGLNVISIPPHKPSRRQDLPNRYFTDRESKFRALIDEILHTHALRQPVLVGTRTIEDSEQLARELERQAIPFRLLNGKQDEDEARIVSRAGEVAAITIATNMAGRGTDIQVTPEAVELGGLHVIGCEHHESSRIDRQLIGRTARQGVTGSCRFFACADDALLHLFAPRLSRRMQRLSHDRGEIRRKNLAQEIQALQNRLEQQRFQQRAEMLRHDKWNEELLEKMAKPEGT